MVKPSAGKVYESDGESVGEYVAETVGEFSSSGRPDPKPGITK